MQPPARIIHEGEVLTDWRKDFRLVLQFDASRLRESIAEFRRKNEGRARPYVRLSGDDTGVIEGELIEG